MFDKQEVKKSKGWGRPRGSRMPEEAKRKISEAVRKRYQEWKKEKQAAEVGMSIDQEALAQEEFKN